MIGVTVNSNAAETNGGVFGLGEKGEILDWRAYAKYLGVSEPMFRQAYKLVAKGDPEPGSSLDRPSLRALAARIAPPTVLASGMESRGARPAPVWSLHDVQRFERERGERGERREARGGRGDDEGPGGYAEELDDPDAPLSIRERLVLRSRGWAGGPRVTRREIAEELGVSEERVRQVERRALARLRERREPGTPG